MFNEVSVTFLRISVYGEDGAEKTIISARLQSVDMITASERWSVGSRLIRRSVQYACAICIDADR